MLSTLSVCPTIPTIVLPDLSVVPDTRYYVCHQLDAGMTLYPNQYLIHGQPGAPIPANATITLKTGAVAWAWIDLLATALTAPYYLYATWQQGTTFFHGTMTQKANAGAAVTATLSINQPAHGWLGDGL